jgi:hypothetical protein
LLEYALVHQAPANIILERDDQWDAGEENLDGLARIHKRLANANSEEGSSPIID